MKINFNMSAIFANDNLAKSDNALSTSIEKLSSGYKINHAKDNPSGVAISKRMHAQIRGLSAATQNASDGISVIETAEGTMTEIHDMLQRLSELSIKAANSTMSDKDRVSVQEEVDKLQQEIDRITSSTEFNGNVLLDGTFDVKGFVEKSTKNTAFNTSAVKVESYAQEAKTGIYELKLETDVDANGDAYIKSITISTAGGQTKVHGRDVDLRTVGNQKMEVGEDGHTVKITADNNFSLTLDIDLKKLTNPATGTFNVDLTGIGPMTTQIGANEGQTLDILIPKVSNKTLGIADLDVSTMSTATASIDRVSRAIDNLSSIRSKLGAYQNRLEHSISSLDITEENMTAAYSRIIDVDMAEEMTEYTKNQVLSQAGILLPEPDLPMPMISVCSLSFYMRKTVIAIKWSG